MRANEIRRLIHEFRDGVTELRTIFEGQRDAMAWSRFYVDGLRLISPDGMSTSANGPEMEIEDAHGVLVLADEEF